MLVTSQESFIKSYLTKDLPHRLARESRPNMPGAGVIARPLSTGSSC
jgi:hypothetical protein